MPVKSNKNKSLVSKKKNNKSTVELKKNKDKIKELDVLIKNSEDKNIRLLAEFDNYKKRKNLEIDNLIKYEGYDFLKNLLSIIDDIDRTLNIKDVQNKKSIFNGVSMIKNKILSLLDSHSIISFESVNELFNPDLHEALMVKKSSKKSNVIIEEFEKGYKYKDRVLRHAKVIVSE